MTLRLWVFSILPVFSLAAPSASVYLSPSPAFGSSLEAAEELSASQAELLLTHHLGLDATSPLDSNDAWWSSIIKQAGGQGVLGQELMSSMNRDAVVVVFEANSEDLHGNDTTMVSDRPQGSYLYRFITQFSPRIHLPIPRRRIVTRFARHNLCGTRIARLFFCFLLSKCRLPQNWVIGHGSARLVRLCGDISRC